MPLSKKRLGIGAVSVLALVLVSTAGVKLTGTTEFCLSCHEMAVHAQELKASPHAKDADGNEIGCSQCHIPSGNLVRMLAGKAYLGTRDAWVHFVEGGYNLDRAHMQVVARRFTDDANCRACHEDLTKNAKKDGPVSKEGKLAHESYLGENGQSRSGCAGCHQNLAHLPVFDQRIPKNAKFLEKMKEINHEE